MKQLNILLDREVMPHHLPFYFARENNRFAQEDIELNIETPDSVYPDLSPLYSGEIDFALTHPLRLVDDFLDEKPVVGLARILETQSGFLHSKTTLAEPTDLSEETRVKTHNLPENQTLALLNKLQGENAPELTSPALTSADGETTQLLEELDAGKIDLLGPANIIPEGIILQTQDIPADFWFFDDFNLPENGELILTAQTEFTNSSPNLIRDFVSVIYDTVEEIKSTPEPAIDFYMDSFPRQASKEYARILLNSSINSLTTSFSQDHQLYSAWEDFLTEISSVSRYLNFDQLLDERFIPLDTLDF